MHKKYIAFILFSTLSTIGGVFAVSTTTVKKATTTTVTKGSTKTTTPAFSVAVWLPYWKVDDAVLEATSHLDKINELSPFAYGVNADGTLIDNFAKAPEPWSYMYAQLKDYKGPKIKVIPSILWNDRTAMQTVLNSKKSRDAQVKAITSEVNTKGYAGIDIDYEGKSAETAKGFSTFLTDLSAKLHKTSKKLICSIEARTPVDSRYATVTPELLARIEYANDYKVIGKVCDEVRIMTYDQGTGDYRLQTANANTAYKPVADIEWVKKVLTLTLRDIPAKKIFVGVPTYGHKYEIVPPTGTSTTPTYEGIGSMNFIYADQLAKSLNITPIRHASGELYFTYSTSTDVDGSPLGSTKQYLIWYSDAQAIADKVRIAKLYGLGGVAVFKVDGANDKAMWNVLK